MDNSLFLKSLYLNFYKTIFLKIQDEIELFVIKILLISVYKNPEIRYYKCH